MGRSSVVGWRGGNSKFGLSPPLMALGLLLCPPTRGVKSAETVPCLFRGGCREGGPSCDPVCPVGVKDSYRGEGCLYDPDPVLTCGDGKGGGL